MFIRKREGVGGTLEGCGERESGASTCPFSQECSPQSSPDTTGPSFSDGKGSQPGIGAENWKLGAQGGRGVSISRDIPEPPGCVCVSAAPGGPAWTGGAPEVLKILEFCELKFIF